MYDINLNVLALCETKLKGRGEELFGDRLVLLLCKVEVVGHGLKGEENG